MSAYFFQNFLFFGGSVGGPFGAITAHLELSRLLNPAQEGFAAPRFSREGVVARLGTVVSAVFARSVYDSAILYFRLLGSNNAFATSYSECDLHNYCDSRTSDTGLAGARVMPCLAKKK